jgi:hypothetical protein
LAGVSLEKMGGPSGLPFLFVGGFDKDEDRLLAIALIASQVTPTPVGKGFFDAC